MYNLDNRKWQKKKRSGKTVSELEEKNEKETRISVYVGNGLTTFPFTC